MSGTVVGSGVTTVLRSTIRVVRRLDGMPSLSKPHDMRGRSFQPTRLTEGLHEANPRQESRPGRPEVGPYWVEADGPVLNSDGTWHAVQTGRVRWHGEDVADLVQRGMPAEFAPYLLGRDELSDWREP